MSIRDDLIIVRSRKSRQYTETHGWLINWTGYDLCPLAQSGNYSAEWLNEQTRHGLTYGEIMGLYGEDKLKMPLEDTTTDTCTLRRFTDGCATFSYYFYPDKVVRLITKGWYTISKQVADA